jgi:hypothetical protein
MKKSTLIYHFHVAINLVYVWKWLCFQVRASAVYALGTFINITTERSEHANNIDHAVAMKLINNTQDGNPIVRKVSFSS